MPNWCSNRITISGAPAQIGRLLAAATHEGKAGEFSLKAIYPVPEGLSGVMAGSDETFHDAYYGNWERIANYRWVDAPEIDTREKLIAFLENRNKGKDIKAIADQYEKNVQEHGCRTWYDWCVRNWGTKWDINAHYDYVEGTDSLTFHCDSAWSPPVAAFEHISGEYPELHFLLEFYEEGCCFMGKTVIEGGVIVAEDEGDPGCEEDLERFDFAPEPYEDEDWEDED
jgi:hypothetical protein